MVKPMKESSPTIVREVLRRAEIKPRVKFVDYVAVALNCVQANLVGADQNLAAGNKTKQNRVMLNPGSLTHPNPALRKRAPTDKFAAVRQCRQCKVVRTIRAM